MKLITNKIAVPTNDGISIFKGMIGRAEEFLIFQAESNGNFKLVEKRPNPHAKTMQHLKTLDVYDLINDCQIILAAKIGKKGIERLEQRNMRLIFRDGNINEQLNNILKSR